MSKDFIRNLRFVVGIVILGVLMGIVAVSLMLMLGAIVQVPEAPLSVEVSILLTALNIPLAAVALTVAGNLLRD